LFKYKITFNLIDSAVWSLIKADLPSLSKQINEINPDEYIAQMDNQLNLINREKEIQNDIDENVAILNSVGKLKSKHNTAYSKTGKTIEKLEDELNKIEEKQELNLINY
jgi:septation ring formation regulator EzrA